jgi:antitoxin ParD1/3/4
MPTRNVVLTDKQAELIEKLVDSGRYQNASEVLREGLRLLQRRELEDAAKLEALRGALDEAEVAVAAGDLYDYSPTLFDMVEEDERVSSTRDSRGWGGFVLPARRDIARILERGAADFGDQARRRYRRLVEQALQDLGDDAARTGVRSIDDIRQGYFVYYLKWSRKDSGSPSVRQPRHLIAFYIDDSDAVIVARLFHERQMLARHLSNHDAPWIGRTQHSWNPVADEKSETQVDLGRSDAS